jgi:hypothetical protein
MRRRPLASEVARIGDLHRRRVGRSSDHFWSPSYFAASCGGALLDGPREARRPVAAGPERVCQYQPVDWEWSQAPQGVL